MAIRLRHKLFVVYLALLAIPWAGCQSISSLENFLRADRENSLLNAARTTAGALRNQAAVFAKIQGPADEKRDLYAHHLSEHIQLDGYAEDWQQYQERARVFNPNNALLDGNTQNSAKVLIGMRKQFFYMLLQIQDEKIVYRDLNHRDLTAADHIRIAVAGDDRPLREFVIVNEAPGWISVYEHFPADDNQPYHRSRQIRGEWKENNNGYTVELRLPLSILGDLFAVAIADVDDRQDRSITGLIGSARTDDAKQLGHLILPATTMEPHLQSVAGEQTRVWVIDTQRRVLALAGSLVPSNDKWQELEGASLLSMLVQIFYELFLHPTQQEFQDDLFGASRLQGDEVISALAGKPATRWRNAPNQDVAVLSAAYPVTVDGKVIGAVVAEQTNNEILSMQNKALEQFFNYGLVTMALAMMILVLFATRLSNRIRALQRQIDHAITHDGQVIGAITVNRIGDEVGDLRRSFADMLERLTQYTRYLETMAGKLSHELRTPLTVVKSSLENLEVTGNLDEGEKKYLERAKQGAQRLAHILTGLSEATRLEQSLQAAEKEDFPLTTVIESCVEGYRLAYPENQFQFNGQSNKRMHGVPELIAQLLDKLVANAVSFSDPDTPIIVTVCEQSSELCLKVSNSGALLPAEMQGGSLFDSMVSLRKNKSSTPHLGLGLYIVRLITLYHGGRVKAINRDDASGVEFSVTIPAIP